MRENPCFFWGGPEAEGQHRGAEAVGADLATAGLRSRGRQQVGCLGAHHVPRFVPIVRVQNGGLKQMEADRWHNSPDH